MSLRVLLVYHHMLGCFMYLCLLNFMQLYDKTFFTLAYPFYLSVCSMYGFLFCDYHQFIDVSRCGNSSWLSEGWKPRCIAYLGLNPLAPSLLLRHCDPCTIMSLEHVFWILLYFYLVLLVVSWCVLVFFPNITDNCREWHFYSITMLFYIILCHVLFK